MQTTQSSPSTPKKGLPAPPIPPPPTTTASNNTNKRSNNNELYSTLNLIILDDKLVIQPDLITGPRSLFIDRTTLKIEERSYENSTFSGIIRSCTKIYGCLGIINLLSTPFLISISEFEKVGTIRDNQIINKVTKTIITPIARVPIVLNEEEKKEEKNYLSLLNSLLESCDFYFSYTFDVTQSEQRAAKILQDQSNNHSQLPLWKRADKRFFWNYYLQQVFIENGFDSFVLPVMDGFIRVTQCEINSNKFKYIFISRRSCKRTGARYHMRGADPLGNVANFVETEQIVIFDQVLTAFVQTRGSIPLIWQQKGKGMKPRPVVVNSTQTDNSFQSHMEELIGLYGPQVAVSLIDQVGGESSIGDAFETLSHLSYSKEKLHYYAFDFHDKCRNNHYENLAELLAMVKPHLDGFGYLFMSTHSAPSLLQTGSFRTNCIDCLDRTNVVQSMLAHYMLHTQMTRMGIISHNERIEDHTEFESQFKHIWADNADVMSEQYTGTVALKTDFTRFGKRSVKGTMTDGVNSVRRYINRSFKDDEKQMAIDLFLGKFVVEKDSIESKDYLVTILQDTTDPTTGVPQSKGSLHGQPGILRFGADKSRIILNTKSSGRKKEFSFSSILLIEKSKLNHRQINLYYKESPSPECILFGSSLIREQFFQKLYKQKLSSSFLPVDVDSHGSSSSPPILPTASLIQDITKDMESDSPLFTGGDSLSLKDSEEEEEKDDNNNKNNNTSTTTPTINTTSINDSFGSPGGPSTSVRKHKLLDMFNSFIGSWNMENISIKKSFLDYWVPKDKDFYSISAQRIASDRPSPGFVMNYKQYWFFLVRQHLGSEYTTIATAVTSNTASIILIKTSLINSVNNVSVSYIQKRQPYKRGGGVNNNNITNSSGNNSTPNSPNLHSHNHHHKGTGDHHSTSSSSSSTSTSTTTTTSSTTKQEGNRVTNFFFGSKKLLVDTSNDIIFSNKEKLKDVQFGTSISLQLRETSLCFLNYCSNSPTIPLGAGVVDTSNSFIMPPTVTSSQTFNLGGSISNSNSTLTSVSSNVTSTTTTSNVVGGSISSTPTPAPIIGNEIIYIKNRQYINGSCRYVFWAGDYDHGTLSKPGWNELQTQTAASEPDPSRGVMYWKSLPETEEIYPNNNVTSISSSTGSTGSVPSSPTMFEGCLYPPVSCSYNLPILSPYTWLSKSDIPSFIILRGLVADQFELLPPGSRLDAYLEFNAPHLISAENSIRTSTIQKTHLPVWSEPIQLESFIDDKEYLKNQFVQVALFNKEMIDQSLIGKASIPLRNACGNTPYQFKVPLTLEDEFSCYLWGEIQIFSKSEMSQTIAEISDSKSNNNRIQQSSSSSSLRPPNSNSNNPSPNTKSPLLSFSLSSLTGSNTISNNRQSQQYHQLSSPSIPSPLLMSDTSSSNSSGANTNNNSNNTSLTSSPTLYGTSSKSTSTTTSSMLNTNTSITTSTSSISTANTNNDEELLPNKPIDNLTSSTSSTTSSSPSTKPSFLNNLKNMMENNLNNLNNMMENNLNNLNLKVSGDFFLRPFQQQQEKEKEEKEQETTKSEIKDNDDINNDDNGDIQQQETMELESNETSVTEQQTTNKSHLGRFSRELYRNLLEEGTIPNSVKYLRIDHQLFKHNLKLIPDLRITQCTIKKGEIPNVPKLYTYSRGMSKPNIQLQGLPNSITFLSLNFNLGSPIPPVSLPNSIKYLIISKLSLEIGSLPRLLPESLTSLTITFKKTDYNIDFIPRTLTKLYIAPKEQLVSPLKNYSLFSFLKKLIIGFTPGPLTSGMLPTNLEKLVFLSKVTGIEIGSIPKSLRKLDFRKEITFPICLELFSSSLEEIYFNDLEDIHIPNGTQVEITIQTTTLSLDHILKLFSETKSRLEIKLNQILSPLKLLSFDALDPYATIQYVQDNLANVGGSILPANVWCPNASILDREIV
eukprot:gene6116-7621_t